jgi:isoquinoline 1-oxidoreductase alpha subunit
LNSRGKEIPMISLNVNGKTYNVDAPKDTPLLWVIRDYLKLTGTKYGCGIGECGSCTVLINGEAKRSCQISAEDAQGADITTIEGLPENHPVKRAWIQEQVVQCGYCQTGVMMQVAGLMAENKNADAQDIIDSMDDVICRCGTYHRMKKGIKAAVEIARKEG